MLTFSLISQAAWACGGMVCNPGPIEQLVVQNAERIAFHIDEDARTVEAHVQVFYEGPPDQFGWVVPVSAEPEVFLSNDRLFEVLGTDLAPVVRLDFADDGNCRNRGGGGIGCAAENSLRAVQEADFTDSGGPGQEPVDVVNQGQVGPYDFSVLQADSADVLVQWLEDNSYAIPSNMTELLQPYLAADAHFLAVRLSKDSDTGDIAPLGWRYAGDTAAIPIQLTAIATAPDLKLEVSVFGRDRAVPESYLHVQINEANLNWFDGGSNYYDLVSRAADQAGGHAFATDYAGTPEDLVGRLWDTRREGLATDLATETEIAGFANTYNEMGLAPNANVQAAFSRHIDGVDDGFLLQGQQLTDVDLAALYADLELYVFEPLRTTEALFASSWVTRMSSSLDADEMTIDPTFVLNRDMGPVSNAHFATLTTLCNGKPRNEAPRELELSDGRVYQLPSQDETDFDDVTYWATRGSDVDALLVERTGKDGTPEVVSDMSESAWAEVDGRRKTCGCMGKQAPFAGSLLALVGAALMRRRRP